MQKQAACIVLPKKWLGVEDKLQEESKLIYISKRLSMIYKGCYICLIYVLIKD
jgi:hypothetical protein